MASRDAAEWAEWEDFVGQYRQGLVGRTEVPVLPRIIQRVRAEVHEKAVVAQVCELDTPHPSTAEEVSSKGETTVGISSELGTKADRWLFPINSCTRSTVRTTSCQHQYQLTKLSGRRYSISTRLANRLVKHGPPAPHAVAS